MTLKVNNYRCAQKTMTSITLRV